MITACLILTLLVSTISFACITPLDIRRLNYFTFIFYLQFCVMTLVGVYLINNGWSKDPIVCLVSEDNKREASFLVLYAVSFFSLALAFFCTLFKRNRRFFTNYLNKPLEPTSKSSNKYFFTLFIIVLILDAYFFRHLGGIPIIEAMRGGLNGFETSINRSEWVFNISPVLQLIRLTTTPLSQIIYFYFLVEWFTKKSSFERILKVFITFMLAISMLLYGGDKAPIVFFLLGHFMLMVLLGKRISFFVASIFILGSVALITAIYFLLMLVKGSDTLAALINRIFVSQISGTYLAYQHFGSVEDFIGFSSQNASLIRLFNGVPSLRVSERLIEYYFTGAYDLGLWKNTNSLFIHEAWGNFGILGALISPIWCAFLIALYFFILTGIGKNSFAIAFLTYASYATISLSSSFNSYIFSVQFVFLFMVFLFGIIFCKYRFRIFPSRKSLYCTSVQADEARSTVSKPYFSPNG